MRTFPFGNLLLIGLILMGCASCGFHMRSSGLTATQSFYVEGLPYSDTFIADLIAVTATAGGKIVSNPAEAHGTIHIFRATLNKRGMSLSQFGQTTMFELTYRVVYDIREKSGEILVPERDLEIVRQYYNAQTLPLAQMQEETVIQQEMRMEAAQALLRQTITALKRSSAKTAPKS